MKPDEIPRLATAIEETLAALGQHYGAERAALIIRPWCRALRDLPLAETLEALDTVTRTCRQLPAPADVRQLVLAKTTVPEDQPKPAGIPMPDEVRAQIHALVASVEVGDE